MDGALRKAARPDPTKRYDTLSEFLYNLSLPNPKFPRVTSQPLMERNPLGFWKGLFDLLLGNLVLFYLLLK